MLLNVNSFDSLDEAREKAISSIDEAAGRARLRYITVIPGQEMTYLEKESQAKAYLAAIPNQIDSDYLMLQAESNRLGVTMITIANRVIANAIAWRQAGALIEAERIYAKTAIDNAASGIAAARARDAGIATLDDIGK